MRAKYDVFFKTKTNKTKTNNFCVLLPEINKGGVQVNHGGCFDSPEVKVTLPHITVNDKKLSENIAKEHTYILKF